MQDSNTFALHRPEFDEALRRGDGKIAQIMTTQTRAFRAGESIIRQGTEHEFVYRLRTGWAARVRTLPDGRAQIILIFLPGDLFAVKSMAMALHPDEVIALSDVTCEHLDYRKLKSAFDQDSDIALRCLWQVMEEERRLHNWIVSLGQGNADERIAQMLLEFLGRLTRSGALADRSREFRLPMTQEQMGNLLGITTVHVNRVLKRLREEKTAVIRGGVAQLLNITALKQMAAPIQDPFERDEPGNSNASDKQATA